MEKDEWVEPATRKWVNRRKRFLKVGELIEVLSRFPDRGMSVDFYVEDVGSPNLEEIEEWEGCVRICLG